MASQKRTHCASSLVMVHLQEIVAAGLAVNVYSVEPLPSSNNDIVALFFLHGRHGSVSDLKQQITFILEESRGWEGNRDLIVITFDHRNHGTRLRCSKANEAWSKKPEQFNEHHAVDMYAIQTGTALDVSFLIDFLPSYLFPLNHRYVQVWGVAGISLGGHSTWLVLSKENRVDFGIPIIGCPNYLQLMKGRAKKSSISFAPPYIPESLLHIIMTNDPVSKPFDTPNPSNPFYGKKILILSGEIDTVVPWEASQEFVGKLEVGSQGRKTVVVQKGIGHECTEKMLKELVSFVREEYFVTK